MRKLTGRAAIASFALFGLVLQPRLGNAGEPYPVSTIKFITHSSPGGGTDVYLRELLPYLQPLIGATLIVENVTGGSGAKAMAVVSAAKPDGGTFYGTTPTYIYTSLLSKPQASYKDLEPVINLFNDPEIIYTAADSPFMTLKDVIEAAKARRGKWGAANPASLERQIMEQIKEKTGVNATIVTFEGGGDMQINVLNHTLDIGVGEVGEIRAQVEAKKVRMLAVVGNDRLEQFPALMTAKEQGVDVAATKFRGLAGPKGMSPAAIAALEAAAAKLLADPNYKKIYAENALQPNFIRHGDYAKFIAQFAGDTEAFLKKSGVIR